jgi:hypothetical protein
MIQGMRLTAPSALGLLLAGGLLASSAPASAAGDWERRIYPAFELGLMERWGSGPGPSVGTGLTYGVTADVIILPELFISPRVAWSHHTLSEMPTVSGYTGSVQRENLKLLTLSITLDYVLEMGPTARALFGWGAAWNRAVLPPLHADDIAQTWLFVEQDGTFVEFPFMIGIEYDVYPEWVFFGVRVYGNPFPPLKNEGNLFKAASGRTPDGEVIVVGPVQRFERFIGASFVLGLVL